MDIFRQSAHRTALVIADYLTPVLCESKFKETGVINPEEFVASGDFLVHHCPTWKWATGDESKRRPFLPPDKQYLITRNVPCFKRLSHMSDYNQDHEKIVEVTDDNQSDGWVDTHHFARLAEENIESIDMEDKVSEKSDDSEAEDMDNFCKSGLLHDPSSIKSRVIIKDSAKSTGVLQTRTYDLYITYDKYYQTPRLWLQGYNEDSVLLPKEQMYEDMSQDHANKTVTFEEHPHLNVWMLSIHPCKQPNVMKKLIESISDGGSEMNVCMYILVFLKFVSAVIPTIEYDYTKNFCLQ